MPRGVWARVAVALTLCTATPRLHAQQSQVMTVQSQVLGDARRILADAVALCGKLDLLDETERALKRKVFKIGRAHV